MPKSDKRIGFRIDGEVTVDDFRAAIDSFADLVHALTSRHAQQSDLRWVIEKLDDGSAEVVASPIASSEVGLRLAEEVEQAYDAVAERAEENRLSEFGPEVNGPLARLTQVIKEGNPRVELITSTARRNVLARIEPAYSVLDQPIPIHQYVKTSVRGRIVSVGDLPGFHFTIQQPGHKTSIICHFDKSGADKWRDRVAVWWKNRSWLLVEGTINRRSEPQRMSSIIAIEAFDEYEPGAWRDAIGCLD